MPFSYTQKSFAGLFHFKYCIENAGNNSLIYEGQNNRSVLLSSFGVAVADVWCCLRRSVDVDVAGGTACVVL